MPKTYQDVISVARGLGIRYIWIDALCIIQDSREDWEQQSLSMGTVYHNSYLTICASNAAAATEGFLKRMPASHAYCGTVENRTKQCAAYLTDNILDELEDLHREDRSVLLQEPLSSRAWCVQERLLSPGKVYYTSKQMIWECQTVTCAETDKEVASQATTISTKKCHNDFNTWQDIVSTYTGCNLTRSSDRFPALSGIVGYIAGRTNQTYVAGHWVDQLPVTLLWHGLSFQPTETYRAPSWSWASVDGKVAFYHYSDEVKVIAKLADHSVTPAGENQFGDLSAGWIEVEGPLLQGRLASEQVGVASFSTLLTDTHISL